MNGGSADAVVVAMKPGQPQPRQERQGVPHRALQDALPHRAARR